MSAKDKPNEPKEKTPKGLEVPIPKRSEFLSESTVPYSSDPKSSSIKVVRGETSKSMPMLVLSSNM